MSPAFDTDFAAADAMFAEAFGGAVTYVRGGSSVSVTAEPVIHDHDVDEHAGARTKLQFRDYLIAVADLVISGSPITPRSGDRIQETINGTAEQFQVMPIGDSPAAEYTDTSATTWLIRTKYIGPVA